MTRRDEASGRGGRQRGVRPHTAGNAARFLIASCVALAALIGPAGADAQITIGELAPPDPPAICASGPSEGVPLAAARASYRVPVAGVITSWSTNAAAGFGQILSFKVYRPLSGTRYRVVGHDEPRVLVPSALNTFKTIIPVQAGDLIGNNDENAAEVPNACQFETFDTSDAIHFAGGTFGDGATFEREGLEPSMRLNQTATILPPPALIALVPSVGTVKGGTSVQITGSNFAEVRSVTFGAVPALSFTVDSESQITALAPPSQTLSATSITVTTVAGAATAVQPFSYSGCLVPKLSARNLKAAKKKLRKAGCKIGKVTKAGDATAKTGKVAAQHPPAGKLLAPGSTVKVTLR